MLEGKNFEGCQKNQKIGEIVDRLMMVVICTVRVDSLVHQVALAGYHCRIFVSCRGIMKSTSLVVCQYGKVMINKSVRQGSKECLYIDHDEDQPPWSW